MFALPENPYYAAAYAALERCAARAAMRTPRSATFIAPASGAPIVLRDTASIAAMQALPLRKRWQVMSRSARAVAESNTAPHYAESDDMAALPPQAFTEWQAAVLEAIRRTRQWTPLPLPVSGAHPDCQCGACLTHPFRSVERLQRTSAIVAAARRKRCQNAA
jgi:hypothetical protein